MRALAPARVPLSVRVLALVLVVVGLVWVTTGASGERAGTVLRGTLAGQPVRLALPTGDGRPRGVAIYFHGQGGSVNDKLDSAFLHSLRRAGWAVATSEFHGASWGNAASTRDVQQLSAWAEEQTGVPVSLWVSGSMGGTTSLNAILHGAAQPRCWYGVKPAISLRHVDRVPAARRFMGEAYDGAVPDDRDPARNIGELPDTLRYRVVASPDDELVPLRENAGLLISSLTRNGYDITYHLVSGPHEDPSHFDPDDLVAFGDYCLGDGPSPASDTPPPA